MQRGGSAGSRTRAHAAAGGPPRRPRGNGRPQGNRRTPLRVRWRRQSLLLKAGYIVATLVAVVAVAAGIGVFAIYHKLDGNITKVEVGDLSGKTVYGSLNILVLGSQTRLGQNGNFGYDATPGVSNSDNLLLIHLDPTHTHAIVLSIPRDTFVYQPACQERAYVGTGVWPAQQYPPGAIIDGALNIGGPTCAVRTVEDLTGIQLDHFVEFNFNSFRTMVGELGGVEVCVPPGPGYHDVNANLNLSPGLHWVDYDQALAYVRQRHDLGGPDAGGDLPRIQVQQAFVSSVIQKVNSEGLLTNIPRLLSIASTATQNVTVDQGLGSVSDLMHLAESLGHLQARNVSLITMPTTTDTFDYPAYAEHLMPVEPQDDVLFQLIQTGQPWTGSLPTEPYGSVRVQVLNGTGQTGLAAQTASQLQTLGFEVVGTGDAPYTSTTTVSYAGLDQADAAYTLGTALNSFPAGQDTLTSPDAQEGSAGTITLTLGADFNGVPQPKPAPSGTAGNGSGSGSTTPAPAPSSGATAVESRNAGASICSGLPPAYTPGSN
jgi:LCP family protein required for cell wall assembly